MAHACSPDQNQIDALYILHLEAVIILFCMCMNLLYFQRLGSPYAPRINPTATPPPLLSALAPGHVSTECES